MRYLPLPFLLLATLVACSESDAPDVDATASAEAAAAQATAEAGQEREDISATITAAAPTARPSPTPVSTPTPRPPSTATPTPTATPEPTPTVAPTSTPRPLPRSTATPTPRPLVVADPSRPHTVQLAALLNERNRLLDEMPDFNSQPSTEEVNAWSRAFRDWLEAQQGYCGIVQYYELERDNCNQMDLDRQMMQNTLSGWQRRSP